LQKGGFIVALYGELAIPTECTEYKKQRLPKESNAHGT
jgi:hypothetical protein